MISISVNKSSLRWILSVAILMMAVFILIDLSILPPNLKSAYMISRVGTQIPAMFLLLAFTFHKDFSKHKQIALLFAMLVVTFSNYWLIQQCWVKAQFAFSYEGTLLHTFFAFFVIRLNFRFGLAYVVLSLLGFGALVLRYPIYGVFNSVNFGFVAMAQSICLVGLYSLTNSLKDVDNLTEKLQELSRIDQLSGLFNRRAYEHDGNVLFEHAKRLQLPLAIFMIDIDNFKDYNDAYGHQKGDEAIRVQAKILKKVFKRQSDIVGRFGGEEFIVIANDMKHSASEVMGQKIIDAWLAEKVLHGKGAGAKYLSCSIGVVSIVPIRNISLKKLIGMADEALFQAKDYGRNRCQLYLPAKKEVTS